MFSYASYGFVDYCFCKEHDAYLGKRLSIILLLIPAGDGQVCGNKVEELCLGSSEQVASKEETLDRGNIFQYFAEEAKRCQTQQEEEQEEDPGKSVTETLSYWEGGSQTEVPTAQEKILQSEGQKRCCDFGESSRWSSDTQTAHLMAKSQVSPYRKARPTLFANERIPLGKKPYKCLYCGRNFNHNSSLTAHEKIHAGKKLRSC